MNPQFGQDKLSQILQLSNEEFERKIQIRNKKEYEVDIGMSGTTCTLAIIIDGVVYYGFIGDSLMCLSKIMTQNMDQNTTQTELIITKPIHFPVLPSEKMRIYKHKGEIRGEVKEKKKR